MVDPRDIRFGHDLSQVQDERGVDVLQLKKQLELSVQERLLRLQQHIEFARTMQGAATRTGAARRGK